jgi:hypothetical protein
MVVEEMKKFIMTVVGVALVIIAIDSWFWGG